MNRVFFLSLFLSLSTEPKISIDLKLSLFLSFHLLASSHLDSTKTTTITRENSIKGLYSKKKGNASELTKAS